MWRVDQNMIKSDPIRPSTLKIWTFLSSEPQSSARDQSNRFVERILVGDWSIYEEIGGTYSESQKKVKREKMGRQIREKMIFLNFEPAAKIIYFRKTKNRISIMTCVDLLYTFLKITLLVTKIGKSDSSSDISENRIR